MPPPLPDFREPARRLLRAHTARWPAHTRLFLVEDRSSWSIHWDMLELAAAARRLRIQRAHPLLLPHTHNQSVFYGSQFFLLADDWIHAPHRIATAYFHGKPGTGHPEFDQLYTQIQRHHPRIHRLQVSHSEMEHILLETGIDPEKLHRIPIGVNLSLFPPQTPERKQRARTALGIPHNAFVVGSFQKDGEGWGDGMKPKLIKGPDIFAQTLARLRSEIPALHVLLSGPARGYLKEELRKLNIPHTHRHLKAYPDIARLYHAIDTTLVTSRQEGGPKAVLESMAANIPLVTTRVGQAMDLVRDHHNGFITDIEDTPALAERLLHIHRHPDTLPPLLAEARKTAQASAYPQLDPLWARFFRGFVK